MSKDRICLSERPSAKLKERDIGRGICTEYFLAALDFGPFVKGVSNVLICSAHILFIDIVSTSFTYRRGYLSYNEHETNDLATTTGLEVEVIDGRHTTNSLLGGSSQHLATRGMLKLKRASFA